MKNPFFKLLFLLFLLLILSFVAKFPIISRAQVVFYDNFDSKRENWEEVPGWELYEIDGQMSLRALLSSQYTFSTIKPTDLETFKWRNYSLELRVLSRNGVDQDFLVRASPDLSTFYRVNVRAAGWVDSDNIRIQKIVNGNREYLLQIDPPEIGCHIEQNKWYWFQVNVIDDTFSLAIRCPGESIFREIFYQKDPNPILEGGIGLEIWSGAWPLGMDKIFDDVKVTLKDKKSRSPIILIPGLGASWNTEALLFGRNKPQAEWKMTPFINIYDNLIEALKSAGYQEGRDLFVFNYDWRKSVTQTATELNRFLEEKEIPKATLIGHSLGGLVSRAYQQDHQDKIEKIITLGTPHKGAIQAYEALAGGKVSQKPVSWESVALGILLAMRGSSYKTGADLLRQEAPVLYNLTPTFNFVKKNRKIVSTNSLYFKNDWLKEANSSPKLSSLYFISGDIGISTPEWLYLRSQTPLDRLLGLWPDGKPYKTIQGIGDQTVLFKSSFLGDSPQAVFTVSHRQLPSQKEVVQKILEQLSASSDNIPTQPPYPIDNTLIFLIASPVSMQIITPDQQVLTPDEQGFVIIPYPLQGEYVAQIRGKESGNYHLIVGQLFNQSSWSVYEGNTEKDQETKYTFQIDPQNPNPNPLLPSEKGLLEAILLQLRALNQNYSDPNLSSAKNLISEAIQQIELGNPKNAEGKVASAIGEIFEFRKKHSEIVPLNKSKDIIISLSSVRGLLLKEFGVSRSKAFSGYRKSLRKRSLAWRIIRIKSRKRQIADKPLLAHRVGSDLLYKSRKYLKEGKYHLAFSYAEGALKFFEEVY